ncbi:MAG TPA: MBL fold metallo-hydrolase [Chitinophagaceae bacterium]|jgi:glyoxylase-like metal-dependent hydrolase (beta-lactamase superfamily II)|nr:MBL fold metallo-hydrolase [Chitinophagaceae bacterium]
MNRALADRRQVTATAEREFGKNVFAVAPGVWRMKDLFVNVFIIQDREGPNWILVDAGLKTSAPKIRQMVSDVLGAGGRPLAIVMTHGHFDHRGSLQELAESWGVPVYCHHMERPYLTGKASYPPPDPTVGGGMMATLSFMYPKEPINIEDRLNELPEDGTIPGMQEWKWIHTPGHTPGHISLFREQDGVLIAGDAFVTTQQESAMSVMTQKKIVCGPPKYFTPDWGAAARTVRALAALEANVIATGHGQSFYGDEGRKALHKLSREFWSQGIPAQGRYVKEPALFNEDGPTYIPAARNAPFIVRVVAATAMIAAGIYLWRRRQRGLAKTLITTSASLLTAPAAATAAPVAAPAAAAAAMPA